MNVMDVLVQNRNILLILFELLCIVILGIIAYSFFKKWKKYSDEKSLPENALRIQNNTSGDMSDTERQNIIRRLLAVDGVDPSPNGYLVISDGGRDYYVRCVTLSKLPKNVRYADTLKPLFMFPNCSSTVFVEPISNEVVSRKIDKQLNTLETEQILSAGQTNRVRKLDIQINEVTRQAVQIERDGKRYFYAGFLFVLMADSVDELNKRTASFRSLALNKKMDISNCFSVQSEAYISSMPINRRADALFKKINSDCVMMHRFDQEALSVILNYTSDHFSHKKGIPLGRNMSNAMPFLFDWYDPSHDGYTVVICGKTNSGKSATMKMMIERFVPLGYRFVLIDSQRRKGTSEGEYASVAEINGGVNYQISSKNSNVINLFDVQESIELVKENNSSGYEVRTLDLNGAITGMLYNLRTIMKVDAGEDDAKLDVVMDSDINDILLRIIKELFEEKGIVHGDADSLYEEGTVVRDGILQSGVVPKKLPTVTECYKKILLERKNNRNPEMNAVYRLMVNNLRESVRELYYTEESCIYFTKEEYMQLPNDPNKQGQKIYRHTNGSIEPVKALFGIRPYFDGQSTVRISRDCPVTNIDISQLPENDKKIARDVSTHFMNEQFIKKNSENLDSADRIVGVIDEAHEQFDSPYSRKTSDNIVRTARKRHAGMAFLTQTVKEFYDYKETEAIFKQAAVKMIFKQDSGDEGFLAEKLKVTDAQARYIVSAIGVVSDKEDEAAGRKHKGEMCVIDGEQILFVKVDYLTETESLAVETDASKVIKKRLNKAR